MIQNAKHLLLILICHFCLCLLIVAQPGLVQVFSNTSISSNIGGFLVYTPKDYNSTNKFYPLLIVFHGQGENGDGSNPFSACTTHGPLKEIKNGSTSIPSLYDQFIILAPQFKSYPLTQDTDSCINKMIKNYRIRGKVFLTGLSQGGGGVWNSATTSSTIAKLAAVVPICGASSPMFKNISLIANNNLPVWTFHGTADGTVPISQSQDWINSINAIVPTINPLARITTFLGVGHDSWTSVFAGYSESGKNIYQWFLNYDTSLNQSISGVGLKSSWLVGETISLSGVSSSTLPIDFNVVSNPNSGVVSSLSGFNYSCTGLGVITITAFQHGSNTYKPAINVIQIISITGYQGTIAGMPLNNAQFTYGDPDISISGGTMLNPLVLSVKSIPSSGVVSINGSNVKIIGVGNVTLTGSLLNQTLTSAFEVIRKNIDLKVGNATKLYGQPNPIFTNTITGLQNGDVLNVTYLTTATNTSGIGNYPIVPSITGSSLANYNVNTIAGTLTVQKANTTVSIVNANKIYGQPNPTFAITITGLQNGDLLNVAYLTSATNATSIGNYPIVPSITGSSLANYNVNTIAGILTIQKANATISVGNATKIYGQPNPTFANTITGLQNGDLLNVAYLTSATNATSIGNYPIVPSITGSSLANYNVNTIAGILTIQKANATISVGNATKIYGQPNPTFANTITGLQNGDLLNVAYLISATNATSIGNYPIVPSVTGSSLSNYNVNTIGGTLTIQKANATVSVGNATKLYGQSNPTFANTITGLQNGDVLNVAYLTTATNTIGIGNYPIVPSVTGSSLANYNINTIAGILTIQKANATISVGNATKLYGQSNPTFANTITGLQNGDVLNVTYLTTATNTSGIGNYPIIPSVTGSSLANYNVNTIGGTLIIQKANATVSVGNATKLYGQPNPIFTNTITGLQNGDVLNVAYLTTATNTIGIGNYPIVPSVTGSSLANYNINTIAGILTIQKANATISVGNATKLYGQSNPTFANTITGLQNGDVLNVTYLTTATNTSGIGNYPIIPSVTGSSLANYNVNTIGGTLIIQKANATISVGNVTKIYGQPNPTFVNTITGLQNGDLLNVAYLTTATNTTGIGNYSIVPSVTGSSLANYNINTIAGILTIQIANVTISVGNATKIYSQPNPTFTNTITGLQNGDVLNVAYLTSATNATSIGNYPIVPSVTGSSLANYNINKIAGILTIQKANATISVGNVTKIYGQPNPTFVNTITGLQNGDLLNVTYLTSALSSSGIGNYPIIASVSGSSLNFYDIKVNNGNLEISAAVLTCTAFDFERFESESNPLKFSYEIKGFNFFDSEKDFQSPINIGTIANNNSKPGQYIITISGASIQNYDFKYVTGILNIKPNISQSKYPTITGISFSDVSPNKIILSGILLDSIQNVCVNTPNGKVCNEPIEISKTRIVANIPTNYLPLTLVSVTGKFGEIVVSEPLLTSEKYISSQKQIELYPNPSLGEFKIINGDGFEIEVYNAKGEKIMKSKLTDENSFLIKSDGLYFIYLFKDEFSIKKKLIIH